MCRNYYWTLGGAGVTGVFVANEELFTVNVDKVCSMPAMYRRRISAGDFLTAGWFKCTDMQVHFKKFPKNLTN